MRTDQYIGLTSDALNFVKGMKAKEYQIEGAWNPITLLIYEQDCKNDPVNEKHIYIEVVQVSPWSSGPMYFTHLRHQLVKKCGQIVEMSYLFSWVCDPNITNEFDVVNGHYYV